MLNFKIIVLLSVLVILVYLPAFNIFFAQDDFILVRHFSQNDLAVDIKNVFAPPTVSHWRPMDNLYYLISGNIFGKNYYGYHLITFLIHVVTGFFIYKIFKKIFASEISAVFCAIMYVVHPAHFVALFWISGAALNIGFLFLILSIYSLLLRKQHLAVIFYLFSLLASEAMLVGFFIYVAILIYIRSQNTEDYQSSDERARANTHFRGMKAQNAKDFLRAHVNLKYNTEGFQPSEVYQKKLLKYRGFLTTIFISSISFIAVRLVFLTPKSTFDIYQLKFSSQVIFAFKYYILRIAGFVEGFGKSIASIFLMLWIIIVGFTLFKKSVSFSSYRKLALGFFIMIIGFFPFVLIPDHLSPNYMIISIWGFSTSLALIVRLEKGKTMIFLAVAFLLISFISVRNTMIKSWVIDRSKLAKQLIFEIKRDKLPGGSTIIFSDTKTASSKEQYIALGTGEAITFWFRDKNYLTCFAFLENCL